MHLSKASHHLLKFEWHIEHNTTWGVINNTACKEVQWSKETVSYTNKHRKFTTTHDSYKPSPNKRCMITYSYSFAATHSAADKCFWSHCITTTSNASTLLMLQINSINWESLDDTKHSNNINMHTCLTIRVILQSHEWHLQMQHGCKYYITQHAYLWLNNTCTYFMRIHSSSFFQYCTRNGSGNMYITKPINRH